VCRCLTYQVEKEVETFSDVVFVKEKTNYKSILYKTYFVLEYAVKHYEPTFVLKTDDDAFVNVPAMTLELRAHCENPDCRNERLYIGRMARASEVFLQPGHKWSNSARFQCLSHQNLATPTMRRAAP
jgi:Galactosyltransferase